jgi:hypothetical protein
MSSVISTRPIVALAFANGDVDFFTYDRGTGITILASVTTTVSGSTRGRFTLVTTASPYMQADHPAVVCLDPFGTS